MLLKPQNYIILNVLCYNLMFLILFEIQKMITIINLINSVSFPNNSFLVLIYNNLLICDFIVDLIISITRGIKEKDLTGFDDKYSLTVFLLLLLLVTQLCLTLCDPMGCSLAGSSVHGILQARILEWAAISFSRLSQYNIC